MTDDNRNAGTPLLDVPTGRVDVRGRDGVVWKTVVKLLHPNLVSVAVEKIGADIRNLPAGFDLYRDPNSGELREVDDYPWDGDVVSVWRERLGDEQFREGIKLWRLKAKELRPPQNTAGNASP